MLFQILKKVGVVTLREGLANWPVDPSAGHFCKDFAFVCSHTAMAELSSCNTDDTVHKAWNSHYLSIYRRDKGFITPRVRNECGRKPPMRTPGLAPILASGDNCDVIWADLFLNYNLLPLAQLRHSFDTFSLDPCCVLLAKLSPPLYKAAAKLISLLTVPTITQGLKECPLNRNT